MLYVSGEESVDQVRLRARRLGLADAPLELAAAINVRDIAATLERPSDAALVVIDSIQTMWLDSIDSAPGTVSQVRACSLRADPPGQARGFALVLVGHVTKDGAIAGPRVLEHMVDAVLYFEGDRGHQFRILRGVKNRFGATDEIGVFEMTERGLAEVPNPSALFLAERRGNIAGSAVFAGLEGTRPVLVEVQALLAPNAGGARAAPWSAGTAAGCRCCWRCWTPAPGCACRRTTSTSTWPAACASASRRPTWRWPPPSPRPRPRRRPTPAGVFRRGRPVRRGAAGGAGRRPAEGGAEAGLRRRLPAAPRGPRQPHARGARRPRLEEIGHLADLVAASPRKPASAVTAAVQPGPDALRAR